MLPGFWSVTLAPSMTGTRTKTSRARKKSNSDGIPKKMADMET